MGSQLCTPDFIEFLQNLLPGKIYKIIYGVLHSGPIFYMQLDCMS